MSEYLGMVIVWNGVIASYSSIKHFIEEGDEIRIANYHEVKDREKIQKSNFKNS